MCIYLLFFVSINIKKLCDQYYLILIIIINHDNNFDVIIYDKFIIII